MLISSVYTLENVSQIFPRVPHGVVDLRNMH